LILDFKGYKKWSHAILATQSDLIK
jgi:hypothetical protein